MTDATFNQIGIYTQDCCKWFSPSGIKQCDTRPPGIHRKKIVPSIISFASSQIADRGTHLADITNDSIHNK